MMQVVYSIGAKFAGGGIGSVAYHAVQGLYRHGLLKRLLCGSFRPTEIPQENIRALGWSSRALRKAAVYDSSRRLSYIHNLIYDIWAARLLEGGDLFHVWGGFGLRSLRRAKARGMVTVVERASSHPLHQAKLVQEEYARWGLTFRSPQATVKRSLAEVETSDYVLIPSDFVHRTFVEQGFPEERLLKIAFGVDTTSFQPPQDTTSHPFRVLFVGRVGIRKGVPYLLEAWRRLAWPEAELWIVGRPEPDFEPLLAPYREMRGLRLIGYTTDLPSLYHQADVFVFPTLEEGSALVTYEALACGLPVVTTPNAGSVVRDGVEGVITPIRDAEMLATALERLRAEERLRREMGKAARARAEEFTWDHYRDSFALTFKTLAPSQ